jgi:hypothetical protein
MIGVMMRQEQTADLGERNSELMEPLHGAAAGVENEFVIAGLDQGARTEAVQARRRRPRSQQRYSKERFRKVCHGWLHLSGRVCPTSPGMSNHRRGHDIFKALC